MLRWGAKDREKSLQGNCGESPTRQDGWGWGWPTYHKLSPEWGKVRTGSLSGPAGI